MSTPDTVSARVEIDLNELAKTLVENLDGDRLAGFIYNLVGLRDDDAWESELIAELSEPYEVPALSSSEDTPRQPRVWQEDDLIPADVPRVHGKRGEMSRHPAAQNRGPDGWWSPGTGVISEHRLLSEHGPVSEVLPDATGGES